MDYFNFDFLGVVHLLFLLRDLRYGFAGGFLKKYSLNQKLVFIKKTVCDDNFWYSEDRRPNFTHF